MHTSFIFDIYIVCLKMNAAFYLLYMYLNRLCEHDCIKYHQYLYIYTIHEKMNASSILNIYSVCVKMHIVLSKMHSNEAILFFL